MSTEPATNNLIEDPAENYGIEYTYADYLQFGYEEMVELIRGKIFKMSPAPKVNHQSIVGNLYRITANFLYQKACKVYISPIDVVLPIANKKREKATTVVQPDLVVICDNQIVEEAAIFGVPDFLIEVISPHTSKKDIQLKYEVYEEAGVNEYWIIYPNDKIIELFLLENGKYKRVRGYAEGDIITPFTLPDLAIDVSEVFAF